jgi:hypothetical protein
MHAATLSAMAISVGFALAACVLGAILTRSQWFNRRTRKATAL